MYELGVVYRNIRRAEGGIARRLGGFGTATVHEAMGRTGLLKPYMRPIYAGAKAWGTAVTVLLHPAVPPNSIKEFIAYCKANPGKLNCAATGYGGLPHLVAESFKAKTGADYAIIQYKGGGDSVTAVLGHQVDMTFETTTILLPHIREGKLKGLAVTSAARNPQAPDIPTMVEAGVPDYVARASTAWSRRPARPPL